MFHKEYCKHKYTRMDFKKTDGSKYFTLKRDTVDDHRFA